MAQAQQTPSQGPAGPHGNGFTDPNERLRQLRDDLARREAYLASEGKQLDDLKTGVEALAQSVEEAKATVESYATARKEMEKALRDLRSFYDQKSTMVDAAIGEKKGPIGELLRGFDKNVDDGRERLKKLPEQMKEAFAASEKAKAVEADKQKAYDDVKAYLSSTQAKLTELEGLRADITNADDATAVETMYFLVLEFKDVLEGIEILAQDELARRLQEKLAELEAAKEDARAKKGTAERLQADLDTNEAMLATKTAGRRGQLLEEIHALRPTTGAAAGSAPPASGASPAAAATGEARSAAGAAAP